MTDLQVGFLAWLLKKGLPATMETRSGTAVEDGALMREEFEEFKRGWASGDGERRA